jgi:hypothetical protein
MRPVRARAFILFLFVLHLLSMAATRLSADTNPVPLINSLSPMAVSPGSASFSITVTGANFNSSSVVNWNGSPRSTTFVNPAVLKAVITTNDVASQGTAVITVTNPAPSGGISNQQFFSINPPASQILFSTNSITGQVDITSNVVEGDFNHDGKLDLAVALNSVVYVLLGNGDGTFQAAIGTSAPSNSVIQHLFVTDANQDGKLDLYAVAQVDATNDVMLTFFGNGDGTFVVSVQTEFVGGGSLAPQSVVFADFFVDGALCMGYASSGAMQFEQANADGTFFWKGLSEFGGYQITGLLAVADFTGQGAPDLLVTIYNGTSQTTSLALITDAFAILGYPSLAVLSGPGGVNVQGLSVVVADFNGDGFPDVAVLTSGSNSGASSSIMVALNAGNPTAPTLGTFQTVTGSTALGKNALLNLISGDFNGDGKVDLAAGGLFFFGKGDGTFPTTYGTVSQNFRLSGDFNNDGKPDIIRDDPSSGTYPAMGILQQIPPAPEPDFTGTVSPRTVTAGLNSTSSVIVNLTALSTFTSDVTLTASGLPGGVTASFTPTVVPGGKGASTLALNVGSSVALGSYEITITGTGGGITHSTTFDFLVNVSPGDFTGSITPDVQNVAPGQAATFSVSVSPILGFTGNVALSLTGALPSGATYTFNPTTITGGSGTSTLTVNIPAGASAGVYHPTITATSGIITRSHTTAIGVNPLGGDFTGTFTGSATSSSTGVVLYEFSLQPVGGYTQPVQISFANLPAGAVSNAAVTVTPGGAAGSVQVTLTGVAPGTYPLLVTLAGPGVVHQVTVLLVVTPY